MGSHAKDKPPERLPAAQRFAGVRLTIVEARGLTSKDSNGSSDPYVELWVDDRVWKSSVKQKSLNPSWGEEVEVEATEADSVLHLVLFDWNRVAGPQFMGEVLLPIAGLREHSEVDAWYELQSPQHQKQAVSGSLRLRATLVDLRGDPSRAPPPALIGVDDARRLAQNRSTQGHNLMDGADISSIAPAHGATARLRLRVVEGTDLPALDSPRGGKTSGTSDAFCMVFLEGSTWRTSTVKASCNPRWPDQPQELPVASLSSLLHVVVFDYDGFSRDDYVGEVVLPLALLRDGAAHHEWLQLQAPPGHEAPLTGLVLLEMQLLDVSSSATARPLLQPLTASRSSGSGSGGGSGGAARTSAESYTPSYTPTSSLSAGGGSSSTRKPDARSATDARSAADARGGGRNPPPLQRSGFVHGTPARGGAALVASDPELQRRLARHRERPLSERAVRLFGDSAPARSEMKQLRREQLATMLQVRVVGGSNLRAMDKSGSSDPYAEVFVWCPGDATCEHMWRTSTKAQTLAPSWNEAQEVPLSKRRALLHVVLFDWDKVGTDEFLGEALLGLDEYLDGARHSLKLELDQLKGNHDSHGSPVTGFIELEVSARG